MNDFVNYFRKKIFFFSSFFKQVLCEIYISKGSFIYNVLLLGFFENSVFSLEICLVMLIFEFNLRLFLISV